MAFAENGGVLPRRQDLPEEAFIDAERLRQVEANAKLKFHPNRWKEVTENFSKDQGISDFVAAVASFCRRERNIDKLLPIVAVSYTWLEAAHPDRDGRQLQLLCGRLRKLYGGRGLLGACRDYGFSDMGVFIDWASGYQKDPALFDACETPEAKRGAERAAFEADLKVNRRHLGGEVYEGSRSAEQKAAFKRMLVNTMDLWFAHAAVTVVLVTQLPAELPVSFDRTRTYDKRGWTTFERCSAELAKNFMLQAAKWKLVIDVADAGGGAQRRLPTTSKRFEKQLACCRFTNCADQGQVLQLYEKTASAILGSVVNLNYMGLPLVATSAYSPARLADALNHCARLRHLNISGTQLDDEGIAELAAGLADGALPALEALHLSGNRFGARGVGVLCDAFRRRVAPELKVLGIAHTPFGDVGATELAMALATGGLPSQATLHLFGCSIGDDGAKALAHALSLAAPRSSVQVLCAINRIGLGGQLALMKAIKKTHGLSFTHMDFQWLFTMFGNGPLWPAALSRALCRGQRRAHESGRMLAWDVP